MKTKNFNISDKFEHLLKLFNSNSFINKQGLGKEVPFFICPFKPEEKVEMEKIIQNLIKKLKETGIEILEINLYKLVITMLNQRNIFQKILIIEQQKSKNELKELLQNVLDPETHIIPEIYNRMNNTEFHIMFITGIGEVYPYIRSHNILNNLQSTATEKPTVMFFPGAYTHTSESGASLNLFGRLHDDKYYRAFNIYDIEI
jgi:hypothetical protein